MKRSKATYAGLLITPIDRASRQRGLFEGPRVRDKYREREVLEKQKAQLAERFEALFGHYGIEKGSADAWRELAMALAVEHVAGFRLKDPNGRPAVWGPASYHMLYCYYLGAKRRMQCEAHGKGLPKVSDTRIAERLVRDVSFRGAFGELANRAPKTLSNLFSEAKTRRQAALQARRQSLAHLRRLGEIDLYDWGGPVDLGGDGEFPKAGSSALYQKYGK